MARIQVAVVLVGLAACGDLFGPAAEEIQPRSIVFASNIDGDYDIYAMRPDGTDVVQLTNAPGDDRSPAWSPDGRRVAFDRTLSGEWSIHVMLADGTNVRRLFGGARPRWSPDGKRLVGISHRIPGLPGSVVLGRVEAASPDTILQPTFVWTIDWSGRTDRILFNHKLLGSTLNVMSIADPDGSNVRPLGRYLGWPTLSPDGSLAAGVAAFGHLGSRLAVMALETLEQTDLGLLGRAPRWSPDQSELIFQAMRRVGDTIANELAIIPVAGGDWTYLTSTLADEVEPDWRR